MKVRQGFVSNSSSTSFLVAFVPEEDNLNLKTFDYLLSAMNTEKMSLLRQTAKQARDSINDKLINYREVYTWLEGYLCILKHCATNKEAKVLLNELGQHLKVEPERRLSSYQYGSKCYGDELDNHIMTREGDRVRLSNKIAKEEAMLAKLDGLADDAVVAGFTEDLNFGNNVNVLGGLMDLLVEDSRVVVLEKVTT